MRRRSTPSATSSPRRKRRAIRRTLPTPDHLNARVSEQPRDLLGGVRALLVAHVQAGLRAAPKHVLGRLRPLALTQIVHLALGQPAAQTGAEVVRSFGGAEQHVGARAIKASEARNERHGEAGPAAREIELIAADAGIAEVAARERCR